MRRLEQRLDQIERQMPGRHAIDAEAAQLQVERERALWSELFGNMGQRHVEIVAGELAVWAEATEAGSEPPAWSRLAQEAYWLVYRHFHQGAHQFVPPLDIPPDAAEVYIAHPDATAFQSCEACGVELPFQFGTMHPPRQKRRFFDRCPRCGGHVGTHAHYYTMRGLIQRCPDCDKLMPGNREQARFLERHHRTMCSCGVARKAL